MDIGFMIRARRLQLHLTLTELAKRSGLSTPFLSQAERGESGLSLSSLVRVAEALGVSLNYFVTTTAQDNQVRTPSELEFFTLDGLPVQYARLGSGDKDRELEALLVVIPPGYSSEPLRHAGEEFFYVLQGELVVHLNGATNRLGPGSTAHFKSGMRHKWRNVGEGEVRLIWVGTPTLFS